MYSQSINRTKQVAATSDEYCLTSLEYTIAIGENAINAVASTANGAVSIFPASRAKRIRAITADTTGTARNEKSDNPKTWTVSRTRQRNKGGVVCSQLA